MTKSTTREGMFWPFTKIACHQTYLEKGAQLHLWPPVHALGFSQILLVLPPQLSEAVLRSM
jgi:hypothetical protein